MSCGKPHETDCAEVLGELYRFLDHELDGATVADIRQHLDECAPCLTQHEVDLLVQRVLARACRSDRAPAPLRDRVVLQLHQVTQVTQVTEIATTPFGEQSTTTTTQSSTWRSPPA